MSKSTSVCFSITGEFITEKARDFWAEGLFSKAFDVLECLIGSTREQHEAILFGKAKLTGVNEVAYVPDDWTPPKDYATVKQALQRGEHYSELLEIKEVNAKDLLQRAAKLDFDYDYASNSAEINILRRQAAKLIGKQQADELFEQELTDLEENKQAEEEHEAKMWAKKPSTLDMIAHHAKIRMELAGFDTSVMGDASTILNRGFDVKPKLCSDMSSCSGWLLPDGKFYGCQYMEHIGLACQLLESKYPDAESKYIGGFEGKAEDLGWAKIAKHMTGTSIICKKKLTQKQRNKIFEYSEYHKLNYDTLVAGLD